MTKSHSEVFIVAAARSPVGKAPRGKLSKTRPDDLLALVIKGLLAEVSEFDHSRIEDVVAGCAMPEAEQGLNVARRAVLLAGLPDSVAGMTINRFCASGLQAIAIAADRISSGQADILIAGGTESMSMIPMGGFHMRANPAYFAHKEEQVGIAYGMGITAEIVANTYKITRERQDAFALQSHQRAIAAQTQGEFRRETIPVPITHLTPQLTTGEISYHTEIVNLDEGPRPDTSLEKLAVLKPSFAVNGCVTAGNSSQMSDGAGAVLLASERAVKEFGFTPLALFKAFSVAGVPPEVMGIGPKIAIPKVLKAAGVSLEDIAWIELNEAFAAQSLAVVDSLGLDPAKVNPLGGAIALGHPLGATGAIRAATLVHGLQRRQARYGLVTMCIGTGMGAAGLFERV